MMNNFLALVSASLLSMSLVAQADYIDPDYSYGDDEFRVEIWDSFAAGEPHHGDPITANWDLPDVGQVVPAIPGGEGTFPDDAGTHAEAILMQTGLDSGVIISGSGGYYSFAGPSAFTIYSAPGFDAESILFQVRSIGTNPDIDSAHLYYRETANGPLKDGGTPAGNGFFIGESETFTYWEWETSALSIHNYFITFSAEQSAMSLKGAMLSSADEVYQHLGWALRTETNSQFVAVGSVDHQLSGGSDPEISYEVGDLVEVTAVSEPAYEYEFVGWAGDASGSSITTTVTMAEDTVIRAVFGPTVYANWASNNVNPYVTSPSIFERNKVGDDPDGDGYSNLMEYALGGAPESQEDFAEIQPKSSMDETGHGQLVFRRQMVAEDLEYRVKVSTDLENWNWNGDGTGLTYTEELPDPVFNEDGTETVTVRTLDTYLSGEPCFLRLEVIYTEE